MVVRSWRGDLTERGAAKPGVCGAWPMKDGAAEEGRCRWM